MKENYEKSVGWNCVDGDGEFEFVTGSQFFEGIDSNWLHFGYSQKGSHDPGVRIDEDDHHQEPSAEQIAKGKHQLRVTGQIVAPIT